LHRAALSQRRERRGNFLGGNGKPVEIPFDSAEELTGFEVDVVVGVKNVAAMAGDEVSDSADQSLSVRTLQQQRGRSNGSIVAAAFFCACCQGGSPSANPW
jgi:hypothetical protein